jgi:hypothetical protein
MSDTKEIESLALDKFSFLQDEFGLKKPILNRDRWNTTVSYLSKEIGIEIELDWRDLDVFILITKLDAGRLPNGYYMFNGKTCRIHLEKVLQNNLGVGKNEIQEVIQAGKKKEQKRNKQTMTARILAYRQLLYNHARAICSAGNSLFQERIVKNKTG